jgi:predicted PurR-regulated permease PerM
LFNLRKAIILVSYTATLYFLFTRFDFILAGLFSLIGILTPFIYGFIIAYILYKPYVFIYKRILIFNKLSKGVRKFLSLLICYGAFFGLISFLVSMVVPQIIASYTTLAENLSELSKDGNENAITKILKFLKIDASYEKQILEMLLGFVGGFEQLSKYFMISAYDILTKFLLETYYWTLGVIVSVYMLSGKEKIFLQLRKLKDAFVPQKLSDHIMETFRLCDKKIGKFLIGQLLNSLIVTIICFFGTLLLKTPYALLISVIVGVTNVVPFFGPFFGAIPSTLIVLTVDPVAALWLAVFLFILHQIDGNIIGPRILGSAIGLSGLWIMFGVIVGGGIFGLAGMILGVPIFSVFYVILGKHVNRKLYGKNIP